MYHGKEFGHINALMSTGLMHSYIKTNTLVVRTIGLQVYGIVLCMFYDLKYKLYAK